MTIKEIERVADLDYYLDRYGSYHTKKALRSLANFFGIQRYSINSDYHLDVDGDVKISFYHIEQLPIHFNEISGNFTIRFNHLKTMKGFAKKIHGSMESEGNCIEKLIGLPDFIGQNCRILETRTLEDMMFDWKNIYIGENLSSFTHKKIPALQHYYHHYQNQTYVFNMPFSKFTAAMLNEQLQEQLNVSMTSPIKRKI